MKKMLMEIKVTLAQSEAEQFIFDVEVDGKNIQNCSIGELVNPDHFAWACSMSAAAVQGHLLSKNPLGKKSVKRKGKA